MIEVTNLTKRFGKKTAVEALTFKVRNGRVCGVFGPKGAGVSVLMNMMAGCITPTQGSVIINGYDMHSCSREAKRQIGYLPEGMSACGDMTPYEYLSFMAEMRGIDGDEVSRHVHEMLVKTNLVGEQDRLIGRLSKGCRRRVEIAQTLMGNPDVLLLDEPTEGLDVRQTREITALVRKICKEKTVIIAGQVPAEMKALCDQMIFLRDGRLFSEEERDGVASDASEGGTDEVKDVTESNEEDT